MKQRFAAAALLTMIALAACSGSASETTTPPASVVAPLPASVADGSQPAIGHAGRRADADGETHWAVRSDWAAEPGGRTLRERLGGHDRGHAPGPLGAECRRRVLEVRAAARIGYGNPIRWRSSGRVRLLVVRNLTRSGRPSRRRHQGLDSGRQPRWHAVDPVHGHRLRSPRTPDG